MFIYKAMYKFLDEGGVHGEILDFPGVITWGADLDEARRLLASALTDMAETNLLHGESLPQPEPTITDPEADLEEPIIPLPTPKPPYKSGMYPHLHFWGAPPKEHRIFTCYNSKNDYL
jgi:predicted RNase H-like HicB family nuclease